MFISQTVNFPKQYEILRSKRILLPWVYNFTTFKQKPLRTQILKK